MFLTPGNLVELTDCKRMSDQIRWLRDRGYRFEVSAIGRPKVLIDEVRSRMLGSSPTKSKGSRPRLELVK
jgi:hypothetical protein